MKLIMIVRKGTAAPASRNSWRRPSLEPYDRRGEGAHRCGFLGSHEAAKLESVRSLYGAGNGAPLDSGSRTRFPVDRTHPIKNRVPFSRRPVRRSFWSVNSYIFSSIRFYYIISML